MKNIIPSILLPLALVLFVCSANAQQQPQNTQFMYYKLGYNPAFAGSMGAPTLSAIFRQQWVGLEGAPSIQALSYNMPLMNQRVGIGANLYRHSIGITTMYNFDAAYAYRVRLGQGMLGIGVQGSLRSLSNDFNETIAIQPKEQDNAIPGNNESKLSLNFGAGLYFSSDRFYIGASVPRLLENSIDFATDDPVISREVQHMYLMTGYTITLNDKLKLQPQALFKYVSNAPIDVDANVNLIIQDLYITGLTYRFGGDKRDGSGDSIDLLLAAQMSNNMMFGLSFDFTLSEIRNYTTGSIEASLHYRFGGNDPTKEYVNPRFF